MLVHTWICKYVSVIINYTIMKEHTDPNPKIWRKVMMKP